MYISVTCSFDKGEIWFDTDHFVALQQNVDKLTGRHISTDIYLLCGTESLKFNVIDTPNEIIHAICS